MNVTEYVELWAQGDTATDFFRKKVLLVLGHRDVAKDHFIQFLARNNSSHQIKDSSSSFKPTLSPVKVHKFSSDVTICDFNSFDEPTESVGLPLGISSTYILQKIVNSTEELQIILLINFSSTKNGIDKHHFTAQIRKISSWIQNIDNYTNSIALIVTNVSNPAENQVLVDFERILNHVESFLEQLQKENSQNRSMATLLSILLRKTDYTIYERLGIFRQPNNQIPSNQMEIVQPEWTKLRTLLNDIQFSPINLSDFNFYTQQAAGATAHSLISNIGNELDERIAKNIDAIFQQLQNEFEKVIFDNNAEAEMRLKKMDSIHGIMPITDRKVREVILEIESKLNKLNIHLSQFFLADTFRLNDYLQFLLSADSNLRLYEWQRSMEKIADFIRGFHHWNNFLNEMDSVTSSYTVQKNSEKLHKTFIGKPVTELNDERLQQFMKDYNDNRLWIHYNNVVNQTFSTLKIISLENIFKSNLKPGMVIENNNVTGVTCVFGEFIFLSDIITKLPNEKFLSINAASKIFIDTNMTRSDNNFQMLSIISPVWELPKMQNVLIVLDGRKGYTSIISSRKGNYPGGNGDHGQAGHAGKSAGHFIGVADSLIHHGSNLLISANGGIGGNGTNGGQGGDGKQGDSAVTENCERTGDFDSFKRYDLGGLLYHDYCVYGRHGGDGGRGGNGGVEGLGGFAGDITLIGFEKETNIKTSNVEGKMGKNGIAGAGGIGGKNGKSFKITKKAFWWAAPQCNQESYNYCGSMSELSDARDGLDGFITSRRETLLNPVKIEYPHWSTLLSTYRKYLLKDLLVERSNGKKSSFLEKLNNNISLINLDIAASLADEFFFLHSQYRMTKNLNLVSHFEQLLYRTEYYLTSKHLTNANEYEIAKSVQEAILAKLISIKNIRSKRFIPNLKEYLRIASRQIQSFDSMSRASHLRSEVWNLKSDVESVLSFKDEHGRSVIDNNAAEIIDLIKLSQINMLNVFNDSYEQFEHKIVVLKTLISMRETFHFLRFLEEKGQIILESTVPNNKYFISESEIPAAITKEIRDSVLHLTEIELDGWRKRFEPVLKGLIDNSNLFAAVNSQLRQKHKTVQETKAENFHENRKNIRQFVTKTVYSTADLMNEEQNFIRRLQKTLFLCESEFENCHLLESHKNVAHALQIIGKSAIMSKVQQLSDNIMDIHESFFSGALKNPQHMVLGKLNLTNLLLQLQILFQRMKQTFKLPLPELVEHGFDALEADTKRMECFYTDMAYYQEMKRFQTAFYNKESLLPTVSDLNSIISLSILQYIYQRLILIPFYQLDFPFAYEDASDVVITADNYHTFKMEAETTINRISSKIERGPVVDSVGRAKKVLMHRKVQELYRWKSEENEKTIENLLRGKPVTIKADILKQNPHEQAIRVRNVNLEFQTKNQTLQQELDKNLEDFAVTLKHTGMSYYKCRDSIFTFTHTPLSIYHSLIKSSHIARNRLEENDVYSKLKNSDYFLSPFTTWRLLITHRSHNNTFALFEVLKKYEHNIDIVLKAESKYLIDFDVKNASFIPNGNGDYCDSKAMRKYYKNEDIIFQMSSTSDFSQELDISGIESFRRSKRGVGHYKGTEIAGEKEFIGNEEMNYLSPTNFPTFQIPVQDEIPVLNIAGAGSHGGTDICSTFQYSLNDCLVLVNLIVQRVTDSKQSSTYFQDCSVDYSKVRQCALETMRKFEESLLMFSKNYGGKEYSFDPAPLMEELEQDIINNCGQNTDKILLNAVSPRKNPVRETFFQRLWNKLARLY